jgi:methionyl-tRNA formyltransferase
MRIGTNKIIYMGTPEFAVSALELLNQRDDVDVVLVVSQPDRPRGRGKKLLPSPVKKRAIELGLDTAEPLDIKENLDFIKRLRALEPDLIVVAAYGKILTKELLEIPRRRCVNIHASLLPMYRGAAPIHRAIIAGEKVSGVTLMYMSEGLDQGDMIAKAEISLDGINTGQAYEILADVGAELLVDNLGSILGGDVRAEKQDDAEATYAPPVLKAEGHVELDKLSAAAAVNLIRGVTPKPGAYVFVGDGVKLKVSEAHVEGEIAGRARNDAGVGTASGVDCRASLAMTGGTASGVDCCGSLAMTGGGASDVGTASGVDCRASLAMTVGSVIASGSDGIKVATLDGVLVIDCLQAPGGKMMRVADYLRGHELPVGTMLR